MRVHINARECVSYLRRIGVEVPDATAADWVMTEQETRARNRAHRAELKRSCGHFQRHDTTIHHDGGTTVVTNCRDCGAPLLYRGASIPPTPDSSAHE